MIRESLDVNARHAMVAVTAVTMAWRSNVEPRWEEHPITLRGGGRHSPTG